MKEKNILAIILVILLIVGCWWGYYTFLTKPTSITPAPSEPGFKQRMLVVFTTMSCPACKQFKKDAATNTELRSALKPYVVTYMLGIKNKFGVQVDVYPTFVLVNTEDSNIVLKKLEGYSGPDDFIKWLNKKNLDNDRKEHIILEKDDGDIKKDDVSH